MISHKRYEVLRTVQACIGVNRIELGQKGRCRFCGLSEGVSFRQKAHAFPEALGNKWIFSLDECDSCNALFSKYEDALANSVAPLLTFGGIKGKNNKIRQTGRSTGNAVLKRDERGGPPRISSFVSEFEFGELICIDPIKRLLSLKIPIAGVPFRPRHAYKALCKMAYALLPDEKLGHYETLRKWLMEPEENAAGPVLDVAMSMGSMDNAPPLVHGALLQRINPADHAPELLFLFSAGSVCLQINLSSDGDRDQRPPLPFGAVNIRQSNIIGDDVGQPHVVIDYGDSTHFDWSEFTIQPQPIEAVALEFDLRTSTGRLTPLLRS